MLPQLPKDVREAAAQAFLARGIHQLSNSLQEEILKETFGVLNHPEFGALFGPGSRAESSAGGRNRRADLVRSN